MEKYKQRKQTNNLLRVFLLTFFTFASLFSVTGIVYSLVTVGIGNPLSLLCAIGFATCTTLSACNAYAIRNNITHRRGAPQKETACSTNKKPITLEGNSKNLIDLSDQPTPNEKCDTQQYTSNYIPKTGEGILIPEIVQDVEQNKLSLALSSKEPSDYLKSPHALKTHGTSFGAINCHVNRMTNQNSPAFHQSQKNSTLPISRVIVADKPKALSQSQNINNPSKSTAPIPPPMPTIVKDKPKTLSQSQVTEQNNSNKKEEASQQPNSIASVFQAPPPPPPMPENSFSVDKSKIINQLQHIKDISQTKLKCVDESEKNKYSKSDNRNKLLKDIRKNAKLRRFTDEEIRQRFKAPKNDGSLNLESQLKKRAKDMGHSDDESGHSTPDSDWEEDDVKTFPKAQVENNNKSTEDYVEGSNHHIDGGISDGEGSPERISNNISEDRQLKSSLPHLLSNNDIKRSVEQPQGPLSCSSSYPNFTDNLSY